MKQKSLGVQVACSASIAAAIVLLQSCADKGDVRQTEIVNATDPSGGKALAVARRNMPTTVIPAAATTCTEPTTVAISGGSCPPGLISAHAIKQVIAEQVGAQLKDIRDSSHLLIDLGADSLDCVELTLRLEEASGRKIDDADAEKWTTVESVIRYFSVATSKCGKFTERQTTH